MNAVAGIALSDAVSLLLALIDNAAQVSTLIQTAQAAGQTTLTPDQWSSLVAANDAARAALVAAINKSTAPAPPTGTPPV